MSEVFIRRLRTMDGKAKACLGQTLKTTSEPALVRSAFHLPAAQREAIQNALSEAFSSEVHVRFETAPDLVSGIEVTANGRKIAWSIADYLGSVEEGIGELLKEKDRPEAKPKPNPQTKAKSKPKPDPKATPETEVRPASRASQPEPGTKHQ